MSSCCDDHQELADTAVKKDEKEPAGFLNKFLWKIGKADAEKKQGHAEEKKGCC